MNNLLIVFAKWPREGITKTRISQELGNELSYGISVCCLRDLMNNINLDSKNFDLVIATSTQEERVLFEKEYGVKTIIVSEGSSIKQLEISIKFNYLFSSLLKTHKKVILIPMDIPFISAEYINKAFLNFKLNKFVLGPENNGGVYLIGLSGTYEKDYFDGVPWSTKESFQSLLSNCGKERTYVLEKVDDLNYLQDIKKNIKKIKNNCPELYAFVTSRDII